MDSFNVRYAELAADLAERIEQIQLYDVPCDDAELAHLWICSSDARNYAVIGDPAVRLTSFRASLASLFRADPASGVSPRASLGPLTGSRT